MWIICIFVLRSVFWRKLWCSKWLVQSVCNCSLICFNTYKLYRYLCADGNVLILNFINVLQLLRFMSIYFALLWYIKGKNIELLIYLYIYMYTGCPRRNVRDFGRVFLMLNYTDITQNTYIQGWTVTEIMTREVWNFDSCYSLIDYQIHIETGRNMWFL